MTAFNQHLTELDLSQLPLGSTVYFLGIAGTGMASVAGLCQEAGFKVCGSDQAVYQPTAGQLEASGIPVFTPYHQSNLERVNPAVVVVGNAISRGNPELEYWINAGRPLISFPQLLGEYFLSRKTSMVITGTHGKTTTTALSAHVLSQLGEEPSWLIGGVPQDNRPSYHVGKGSVFVSEGDEYDTAFFDKGAKFLHYRPQVVLLNNLEHDHVDIYPDFASLLTMFGRLIDATHAQGGAIVANSDSPGVIQLLAAKGLPVEGSAERLLTVSAGTGPRKNGITYGESRYQAAEQRWCAPVFTERWGTLEITTKLPGQHNIANIAGMLACLSLLADRGQLKGGWGKSELLAAVESFPGVKKRCEFLGSFRGAPVYHDFAHHPTAVAKMIEIFANLHPDRRLVVAFDPKNASSRRNVFAPLYAEAFKRADVALIGACREELRIPADQRMNTQELARNIGPSAHAFQDNEGLLTWLRAHAEEGDVIVFLSCGDFSNIPQALIQ
jgi:UDP-N-acetylmuramate: L-alanyl-gamma-D-glutamyl-meso-diaminopimelate ligase